ncbi:glycoside hydrolase family 43 protein [Pelagicoccus mobilis]|uniref:Glycoside hydrolase family 43 protein n=1 Tax=Pelagicoccus mobilis TaxID=415221 RepID=A0A934S0K9_9BACT|nr:glycoside hydrolase family 43 protein [Pelagicoccus mobilis]MBK1878356.1 glycoside hydrolase family 43 protein [Pelagicoccus mobilis]
MSKTIERKIQPLIEQRADPHILRGPDGYYYFSASVPEYDRLELRRAKTIRGLADAEKVTVWTKPSKGPYSELIWAPEIHFVNGVWYIYFAAAPSREIKDDLFQHRMYVAHTNAVNPLEGKWIGPIRVDSGIDTFCLDATVFEHRQELYYVWAQKERGIEGNSNLYIAKMESPYVLASEPVRLSIPEYEWEVRGFWVNEGPSVLKRNSRIFLSYSASATDENYAMGLLYADECSDLLDSKSWTKSKTPVLCSDLESNHFGPGHNSFTVSENGEDDLLVYHAREYTEIVGDPLWDPNRHTFVKKLAWDEDGMPLFTGAVEF